MARVGTAYLNLGKWLDGDNPGAGPTMGDSLGLNGNFDKIDNAIGPGHNADGTHKNDVIDGNSLKASAADGSTLEFSNSSGSKVLRVKNAGITLAKLNSNVADGVYIQLGGGGLTIPSTSLLGTQMANHTIGAAQLDTISAYRVNDGTTIDVNGSFQLEVANNGISAAKLEEQLYIALVTQLGTAAPTVTVVRNTFVAGAPVMSRVSNGYYNATLTGAFTNLKTTASLTFGDQQTGLGSCLKTFASRTSGNAVSFGVDDGTNGHDSFLSNALLIIRVHP